jgi:hypothetical protein
MVQGWAGQPTYSSPPIGTLVGDILRNRLATQVNQQQQMSDLAKTIQNQRVGQAFVTQAQASGLLPQGDLGALGAQGPSSVAELIKLRQAEEDPEQAARIALLKSQAGYLDRNKPLGGAGDSTDVDQGGIIYKNGVPGYMVHTRYGDQWRPLQGQAAQTLQPDQPNALQQAGYTAKDFDPANTFAGKATRDAKGNVTDFTMDPNGPDIMVGGTDVGASKRTGGDVMSAAEIERARRLLAPKTTTAPVNTPDMNLPQGGNLPSGGAGNVPPAVGGTQGGSTSLDANTAQQFLNQANGDPDVARKMARDAGYVF